MLEEAVVTCPACWQDIVLELDLSGGSARYAEDCPVCCRPMTVSLHVDGEGGFEVSVEPESD
ncbi:CPXCG motif-containing cysteine-rich protein [Sinimarinibacterium flocculans]|uniref:CPXCG motif-containing cysteine-rich protein n=1 Tax=Sinimarinibacterium flocculans TaxID=985250 RepID=UPI002EBB9681|nr:CPXCG motif-containing cysteine-rich protein [Pseudomonadota bacterium]